MTPSAAADDPRPQHDAGRTRSTGTPPELPLLPRLERHCRDQPERLAFVASGEGTSWGTLGAQIASVAGRLLAAGLRPGDRVVLAEGAPGRFLPLFVGILRAGGVAVPVDPAAGAPRLLDVASLCDAAQLVLAPVPALRWEAVSAGANEAGRTLLPVAAALTGAGAPATPLPALPALPALPEEHALALLQMTSGSTGVPKAVRIRHRDLAVNMGQMVAGMAITRADTFVSWLPLHHDMGLVLMALVPLALGAELHLQPPGMASIRGWMGHLARRAGTFTAAPDFAYRLNLRLEGDRGVSGLGSLRVALNAAEPVRATTVAAVREAYRLGPVVTPAYGLAEATVGVTCWPPGHSIAVDERGFVAVGRGFPGVELGILGEDALRSAGQIGEILVRGPAVTEGYWGEPEPGEDLRWRGWLRTGDLGYLDTSGNLYVVGRSKEVILQGGQTLAPREVEEVVERLPGVRRAAAVGIDRGRLEGEQAYLFVEPERRGRASTPAALAARVAAAFEERLGHRAGRVYVVTPGTIPRTANGKLRYAELRETYLGGELRRQGSIVFPEY